MKKLLITFIVSITFFSFSAAAGQDKLINQNKMQEAYGNSWVCTYERKDGSTYIMRKIYECPETF